MHCGCELAGEVAAAAYPAEGVGLAGAVAYLAAQPECDGEVLLGLVEAVLVVAQDAVALVDDRLGAAVAAAGGGVQAGAQHVVPAVPDGVDGFQYPGQDYRHLPAQVPQLLLVCALDHAAEPAAVAQEPAGRAVFGVAEEVGVVDVPVLGAGRAGRRRPGRAGGRWGR